MELHRTDVVQVPVQSEQTLLGFVVPNFDLVVVTSRDEHLLRVVKVYATYGTCKFTELEQQNTYPGVLRICPGELELGSRRG